MKKTNPSNTLTAAYLFMLVSYLALSASGAPAGKMYFSDDFENGFRKWDAAGDTWQVTDLFYHSPGHCASESPQGNYPRYANSTMTTKLQERINLSNSTQPVLRFWHLIGVHNGDYGYVYISQNNGMTWTELTSFTNTWQSTWSREQVDLSAYKSSSIRIRFCLRDNGDPWVSWGWEIDDVEVCDLDMTTLPFPLYDDFESGLDNWKFGNWQLTESDSCSPTHSMSDSENADYPRHACSDLILAHPIDLSHSANPVLAFWHKIGVYDGDYGYLDVSQDGGSTWHALDPNNPNLSKFTNVWYSTWFPELFDLSAYKSSPILIRFRLRDNGDSWVSWGWDIDDVDIRELFYHPEPLIVQITDINTSRCPEIQAAVIVADSNNIAVTELDASNFVVRENGIVQTPITVEMSTSNVSVGLALDYSGSMEPNALEALEIAATAFVESIIVPGDRAEIIKFAKGVEVMQEYTDDKKALLEAVRRTPALDRSATSLYDAIYQAISDTAEQSGRKGVVAMTDGRNNHSKRSATEVIDLALAAGVPVFTIGLGDEVNEDVLIAIASQTGGIYYYAPGPEDLVAIYLKIAGTLNTQYLVTYETTICDPNSSGDVEQKLNIEVHQEMAYGQGTRRFRCPLECNQNTPSGSDLDD